MPAPVVSVIVPVYNRQAELRRALQSVADQTLGDFECVVVDDGSTQPIRPVVDEFDERFSYVRRPENGGPTAARITGCEHVTGELVVVLDSDNEFFPWALDRAAHYLREHPEADAATGLYVFPDGLHNRVPDGEKLVGPDEYAALSSPHGGDSVGVLRHSVVEEFLRLPRGYFNFDLLFTMTLRMSHLVLLVDEPWARFNVDAADRMSGRRDARSRGVSDIQRFVNDFRPLVGASPCGPVDMALINMWIRLVRARRYRDAAPVADWMRDRGISRTQAARRKATWALRARLGSVRGSPRVYVR